MKKKMLYGFGINTVLTGEEVTKYPTARECAQLANEAGYGFIVGYKENGDRRILAWNAQVVSREEALERYISDGDARAVINASSALVWIVLPVNGHSDIIVPFDDPIRSFKAVKLDEL